MADERTTDNSAGHSYGSWHNGGGGAFVAERYDGEPGDDASSCAAYSTDAIACLLNSCERDCCVPPLTRCYSG